MQNHNSPLPLQLPSRENGPYQSETMQLRHRFPTLRSSGTFLCIISDSPISTATVIKLGDRGLIPNRDVPLCHNTKTDSGDHSTSYTICTEGSSPGVKEAGTWSWSLNPIYCNFSSSMQRFIDIIYAVVLIFCTYSNCPLSNFWANNPNV